MTPRRAVGLLAVAALAALAAGCAGDGDDAAGAPSTSSTAVSTTVPSSVVPTTVPSTVEPRTTAASTTAPPTTTTGPDEGVSPAVRAVGETVEGSVVTPDGRTRTYRVYEPTERDPDAPLLLALHGGSGNGRQFQRSSGFDGLAEANGFLVAYADGTPTALGPNRLVWNAGGCCGAAVRDGVDDVAFLAQLIDTLADEYGIDPANVAVTGHSNGAMMGLALACSAADQVRAVAVQAGTVFDEGCAPTRPVSALDLHGSADRSVPVDGGVGPESTVGLDFPPVRDGLAAFAAAAGCGATTPAPQPTATAGVTVESWSGCPDGVAVELVVVDGAPHAWMRTPVDAPHLLWTFLAAHT